MCRLFGISSFTILSPNIILKTIVHYTMYQIPNYCYTYYNKVGLMLTILPDPRGVGVHATEKAMLEAAASETKEAAAAAKGREEAAAIT